MAKGLMIALLCLQCCLLHAQNLDTTNVSKRLQLHTRRDTTMVELLYQSAEINRQRRELGLARLQAAEGIRLADSLKNLQYKTRGLLLVGHILSTDLKYDSSASVLLNGLSLAERIKNPELIALAYDRISFAYLEMGNLKNAEEYGKASLATAEKMNNKKLIVSALMKLSAVYLDLRKPDDSVLLQQSRAMNNRALPMALELKDDYQAAYIYSNLADIETFQDRCYESVKYNKQSLIYWRANKRFDWIAYIMSRISLGYSCLRNKDSAEHYAIASLAAVKSNNLKSELIGAYNALFTCYKTFGDYKKALEYRLKYDSITAEVATNNIAANTEKTKVLLEQEKKDLLAEKEKAQKEAENKRSRLILLSVMGGLALLAIFLFWSRNQQQKARAQVQSAFMELKTAQAQLIQSEKMASLGELTAGIAHEIQNPLNFVNNFSEVNKELMSELLEEADKGNINEVKMIAADVIENSEKINHHGKRADGIVRGMLQHSRKSDGKRELTDLNALTDEYLRLSYHGLRAKDKSFNATLKTDFDTSLTKVNVVPQDIGRVLLNIVTNAFYAVDEKKKKSGADYQPTVSVLTKKINNGVEISIADNGNGIPDNIREKIFQPFFTTKPTGSGTGLGLSLAYDIVKAHGGELMAKSKVGMGTTFIIKLPAS